jgi:uridylate kinase
MAVVIGGGNILRGRDTTDIDRAAADKAGMLATVINGLRLTQLLSAETPTRHLSAVGIPGTVAQYDIWQARSVLAAGSVVVLSGGTGHPFLSTDTAAALRAAEINADRILKGTRVAGVYSADPEKHPKARLYRRLSYDRALSQRLAVMDLTAFALCMERRMPIVVFDISRPNAVLDLVRGKEIGSLVC